MENDKREIDNECLERIASDIAEQISDKFALQFEKHEDDIITIIAMLAEIKYYIDEEQRKRNPDFVSVVPIGKI